jgi:hypothetical protein
MNDERVHDHRVQVCILSTDAAANGSPSTVAAPQPLASLQEPEASPQPQPELVSAPVQQAESAPEASTSKQTIAASDSILSDQTFATLDLCSGVTRAVEGMGHKYLTLVQQAAIPPLLQGRDLLGAARTGADPTSR